MMRADEALYEAKAAGRDRTRLSATAASAFSKSSGQPQPVLLPQDEQV